LKILFSKPKTKKVIDGVTYIDYSEAKRLLGVEYTKLNIVIFVSIIMLRITNLINSDEMSFLTILLFTTLSDYIYPINTEFTKGTLIGDKEIKEKKRKELMRIDQFYTIRTLINILPISVASLTTVKILGSIMGYHIANEGFFTVLALTHTIYGSWVSTVFNKVYNDTQ